MNISIELDRQTKTPLYLQISDQITREILSGALKEGTRLPAERKLAQLLGVNRSTVINAYSELEAGGYIVSHVGRGTEVAGRTSEKTDGFSWNEVLSGQGESLINPYSIAMSELLHQRDLVLMDSGIADPELYPYRELAQIFREVLTAEGKSLLQHNCPQGLKSLRESLFDLIRLRGYEAAPENIVVLNGSQQGLDLIARLLLEPGDAVITEQPAFLGAIDIFRSYGAKLIGIPLDSEGMMVDRLERVLSRVRPKLIYTIPTFQNPSGVTMSIQRRRQLIELACRYRVPVLEDDAYGLLNYGSPPPPPLASMDKSGIVIYLGTLSKMLCPGLRLGWMAVPPEFVRMVSAAKQLTDLHTNNLLQRAIDLYLRKGLLLQHLAGVKQSYILKRDTMLKTLEDYAPGGVSWNRPEGGFYIWASLPENLSSVHLLQEAVKKKVSFVAGPVFYPNGEGSNMLRLNFTHAPAGAIKHGIKALCVVIRELQERNSRAGTVSRREFIPIV